MGAAIEIDKSRSSWSMEPDQRGSFCCSLAAALRLTGDCSGRGVGWPGGGRLKKRIDCGGGRRRQGRRQCNAPLGAGSNRHLSRDGLAAVCLPFCMVDRSSTRVNRKGGATRKNCVEVWGCKVGSSTLGRLSARARVRERAGLGGSSGQGGGDRDGDKVTGERVPHGPLASNRSLERQRWKLRLD